MRRAALIGLCCLSLACGADTTLFVELPGEGLGSAVIMLERPGHPSEVWGFELDDPHLPLELPVALAADDFAVLHFVGYAKPLSALWAELPELEHGHVLPTAVAGEFAVRLPAEERVYSTEIEAGGFGGWETLDAMPSVLADLRIGTGIPSCPELAASERSFNLDLRAVSLVPLDSERVLALPSAMSDDSRGYVVTATSATEIDLGLTMGATKGAWAVEPDGRIWVGGFGGRLWSGTIEGGFTLTSQVPAGGRLQDLALPMGARVSDGMYVVVPDRFLRFDGADWETIYQRTVAGASSSQLSRVATVAPNEAFAVLEDEVRIHHARDATLLSSSEIDATGIRDLLDAGSLGVLAIGAGGRMHRLDEANQAWEALEGAAGVEPHWLELMSEGVVLSVGEEGDFAAYVDAYGWCPVRILRRALDAVIAVNGELFVSSIAPEGVLIEIHRRELR